MATTTGCDRDLGGLDQLMESEVGEGEKEGITCVCTVGALTVVEFTCSTRAHGG